MDPDHIGNQGDNWAGSDDELLQRLFYNMPIPSWIIDRETMRFLEVNEAAIERYGYTRETFLRSELYLLRPNDSLDNLVADYQKFVQSPKEWFERRHRSASGEWINVSVRVESIEFQGAQAVLVWVRDDSIEMQFEEGLRNEERRNREILNTSLDAIVIIDRHSTIIGWNTASENLFGWSLSEVLGRPMHEIIMPERFRERHLAGLGSYLVTGQSTILNTPVSVGALRRDGDEFRILLKISRIGRSHEFVAYIRDQSDDPSE